MSNFIDFLPVISKIQSPIYRRCPQFFYYVLLRIFSLWLKMASSRPQQSPQQEAASVPSLRGDPGDHKVMMAARNG